MILAKILFIGLFGAIAWFFHSSRILTWEEVILLGLACSTLGRAISYLGIFEWLRTFIGIEVLDHSSGVGEGVHPREDINGFRKFLAELICCPVCTSTWGALALLFLPPVFTYIFAAVGVGWLLTFLTELVEWTRHKNHEETAQLHKQNNGIPHDYPEV